MEKTPEQDRRAFNRAKRVLSIEYRLSKGIGRTAEKKWHLSTTYDMSVNGVAFFSEFEYQQNDILDLKVTMSGLLEIYRGLGTVVRLSKKKSGIYYLVGVKLLVKKSETGTKLQSKSKTTKKHPSIKFQI
ncbi:MAG: PilZ domain-containing protein [Candidatus Omnitrophica bacterium]|nr:PilZ domain-containing protein [Candidatus Omnitrophota bacterium]